MQLALLEHLSARSGSGDAAKLDGRRFMVSQRAVLQGDRVLADLMLNRIKAEGHLEGRVALPLDQTLVFGQAGIQMLPEDVLDRSGETTACYIVRARVRRAIEALPILMRRVVVMTEMSGLSHAEVAATLQFPVGTVVSRRSVAMARLRGTLADVELAHA